MAQTLTTVQPGDLISADLMNRIMEQINLLESRVGVLEAIGPGGDVVVITGLLPSGPASMGSELRVVGRNFGVPGSNIVTIDNVHVTQFKPGSSDTQLIFNIPLVQGVPPAGKVVTLTVSNPIGFASTSFILLPAQPTVPTGSLFVTLSESPPEPQLQAGQSYTFVYTVKAITNMDEVYALGPSVQAGWPASIVDQNNIALTPQEISIPKGDPPNGSIREVRVRMTIPADAAAGASSLLRLTITSKRNPLDLAQASAGENITVGSAPPPPQEIALQFSSVLSPGGGAGTASESNGVVTIPTPNVQYRVSFIALIKDPGRYQVVLTNPGNNWVVRISGGDTATTSTLTTSGPNTSNLIHVFVTAQPGATPVALSLRVTKEDDATIFGERSIQLRTGS